VQSKKLPKRQKVARAEPREAQKGGDEEISAPDTFKGSVEDLDKKRRLQEAAKNLVKCGAKHGIRQPETIATMRDGMAQHGMAWNKTA
jgi:hypothetical protein